MSVANTNSWVVNGIQYAGWTTLSSSVAYGTTGSIANGSYAEWGELRGIQSIGVAEPEAPRVTATGNNGVVATFINQPQELPNGTLSRVVYDEDFSAKAKGLTVSAEDDWDVVHGLPECYTFGNIGLIFQSPGQAQDTSNTGENGYQVVVMHNTQIFTQDLSEVSSAEVGTVSDTITLNRSSKTIWNATFPSSARRGYSKWFSAYPVWGGTFVGDGTETDITLAKGTLAGTAAGALKVWQAGTRQVLTTNYTVSGNVITLNSAPGAGVVVTVLYQYIPTC